MNRAVLSGVFTAPPKIDYLPSGLAVTTFTLAVPRTSAATADPFADTSDGEHPLTDEIPCIAFGTLAVKLYTWGEPQVRIELEGRLHWEADPPLHGKGAHPQRPPLLRVRVDDARVLDDPLTCIARGAGRVSLFVLLPRVAHPGQASRALPFRPGEAA